MFLVLLALLVLVRRAQTRILVSLPWLQQQTECPDLIICVFYVFDVVGVVSGLNICVFCVSGAAAVAAGVCECERIGVIGAAAGACGS